MIRILGNESNIESVIADTSSEKLDHERQKERKPWLDIEIGFQLLRSLIRFLMIRKFIVSAYANE